MKQRIRALIGQYWPYLAIGAVVCVGAVALFVRQATPPPGATYTVATGTVTQSITVSGFVEAKYTADLNFSNPGTISGVFVKEGDHVATGSVLVTQSRTGLANQYKAAVAALTDAQAKRTALLAGPTSGDRAVTSATVAAAETALSEVTKSEAEKVAGARALLLSSDLTAVSTDADEKATAPTIGGTYTCANAGVYNIDVYSSQAVSGYSYHLSGLESDTSAVYTQQADPLGTCGLTIQFAPGQRYAQSHWTITLPNIYSSSYVSYKNAYDLALQQQSQNVQAAKDALTIATHQATAANEAPRVESLISANAAVESAEARVAEINAQIADQSITAPFAGTIIAVHAIPGEVGGSSPVITLLADDSLTLTARIPEIDIAKIAVGQRTVARFDAVPDEALDGTITYIAPVATEIDGVAYFDTDITLTHPPAWLRAGLNADIDITIADRSNVLRVPTRYLITEQGSSTVLLQHGKNVVATPVTVTFSGNDGYTALTGIQTGDVVADPNNQ